MFFLYVQMCTWGYCGEEGDVDELPTSAVFVGDCAPQLVPVTAGDVALIGGEHIGDGGFLDPNSSVGVS